jgi:hypothetical protein
MPSEEIFECSLRGERLLLSIEAHGGGGWWSACGRCACMREKESRVGQRGREAGAEAGCGRLETHGGGGGVVILW